MQGVRAEMVRGEVGDLVEPCRTWLGFWFLIKGQCKIIGIFWEEELGV